MTAAAPYPGLRPFQADEVDVFFGREPQIDRLLDRLGRGRLLAVVGASGCGKSSLVKAGLIPALETGFLASAGARWRVAQMRPGNQPLRRLAEALLTDSALGAERAGLPGALGFALASLRRGPLGLAEVLTDTPPPEGTRLLLVVDQFEEIFRYFEHGDSDEADAFVALLLAAVAQPGVPIYVVLTMRSDYLGDCALFEGLPEALNESQFLTPRMSREQRREAIVGPAGVFGAGVEPALVNRLLNDMGADPDQLPLMQHVLMRLWHRSGQSAEGDGGGATVLTVADYEAVGGFADALSNHADEAYQELDEEGRRIATRLFRALSERGDDQRDTRRPARLGEVAEVAAVAPERVAEVAEVFRRSDRSFLTPPASVPLAADTVLDVSHESLIRRWRRLRRWVEEESLSASLYRRLAQTAELWRQDEAGLWGPPDLDIALSWQQRQRPTAAWAARYRGGFEVAMEFLAASRDKRRQDQERERRSLAEAEQQRRVRQRNRLLTLGLALATALLLLAFSQWRRADRQRDLAQRQTLLAEAGELMAHAREALEDRPQRSLLLAVEALALEREAGVEDAAGIQALQKGLGASGGRVLIRHQGEIVAVAVSRDGRRLASASSDGTTRVVDLSAVHRTASGPAASDPAGADPTDADPDVAAAEARVWVLDGHPGGVLALDLEPGGRWLATGGADGTARLWDLAAADPAADPRALPGHAEAVTALAFSGGGRRLATGDGEGAVRLWDLAAGRDAPPLELGGHADSVTAIAAGGGGRWLASASEDNTVALWDLAAADPAASRVALLGHRGPVGSALFTPDERWLATAGHDNTVRLWSLSDPQEAPLVLCGHDGSVVSLAITSDGGWLISGSSDATARLWRLPALLAGAAARRRARSQAVVAAAEPDGCRHLVSDDDTSAAVLWDLRDVRPAASVRLAGHHDTVTALALSPKVPGLGRRFLATASRDHTVRVWNLTTQEPGMTSLLLRGHDSAVGALAFSPNAPFLYSGGAASVRLWDLELTDRSLLSILLSGPRDAVRDLALSSDARWLAAGGDDNYAYLWDIGRFQPPQRLAGHDSSISRVGISPDNRWLVTTSEDNTIRLWDLSTQVGLEGLPFAPSLLPALPGRRAGTAAPRTLASRVLAGNASSVTSLAFTPDGRRLATAGRDGTARVWNLGAADPALAPTVLCGHREAIVDLAVSADGRWLASASSKAARLWDLRALEPLLPSADGQAPLLAAALSEDDCRRKSSGGETLEAREVAPAAARLFGSGEGAVTAVAFVPTAVGDPPRWLITGDDRGTARLWPLSAGEADAEPLAFPLRMGALRRIAASPDGRWLALAGAGDTARLMDLSVEPGSRVLVLRDHRDAVTALAFSPDGHWLATGSADGEARLWDLTADRPAAVPGVLYGHRGSVTSVVFAPDSQWLATSSRDHTVRVWSTFLWSLPPERLFQLACRVAGRDLTPEEWEEYLPGRPYRATCSSSS